MEWLDRHGVNLDASQMKNLLILGASRKTDMNYPNQEWGYGALTFTVLLSRSGGSEKYADAKGEKVNE